MLINNDTISNLVPTIFETDAEKILTNSAIHGRKFYHLCASKRSAKPQ